MSPTIPPPKTLSPPAPTIKPAPASTLITRTDYPKWWKDEKTAAISLSDAGTQEVIKAKAGTKLYIATITLSASKDTSISFTFGIFGPSGAMKFGGTDEPKGMVIAMGNSPAPCGPGPFSVTSSGSGATVGGFVVYYQEKDITQPLTKKKL